MNFDPETGEGTIEWPAGGDSKAESGSEAEAGAKMQTTKWQTA